MRVLERVARTYRKQGLRGLRWVAENHLRARSATPTPFPLPLAAKSGVAASLSLSELRPAADLALPSHDDLKALWPVLEFQVRQLHRYNVQDPYFDPEMLAGSRQAGRKLAKNLFEIWAALHTPRRRILEIGTRSGLSLVNKLPFLPRDVPHTVLSFDIFCEQGSPSLVRRNLRAIDAPTDNVFFFVGDSKTAVPAVAAEFPELRVDYALVDGSHDPADAAIDLANTMPLIAPGGLLVFDDTGPTAPGVKGHDLLDVWNAALMQHGDAFESRHYDEASGFCVAIRRI